MYLNYCTDDVFYANMH